MDMNILKGTQVKFEKDKSKSSRIEKGKATIYIEFVGILYASVDDYDDEPPWHFFCSLFESQVLR